MEVTDQNGNLNLVTPQFLRIGEVKRRTGLSRSSIYDEMKKGAFPKNFQLTSRSVAWLENEVEAWKINRLQQR